MTYYKAGTCTAEQVREYLQRIAPETHIRRITTFKDIIIVTTFTGDTIYITEKEITTFENDNSTPVND